MYDGSDLMHVGTISHVISASPTTTQKTDSGMIVVWEKAFFDLVLERSGESYSLYWTDKTLTLESIEQTEKTELAVSGYALRNRMEWGSGFCDNPAKQESDDV